MEMRLKKDVDPAQFLKAISTCTDDVYYMMGDNGYLNLSSLLSKYVFSIACAEPKYVETGIVSCKNQDDYAKLAAFLDTTNKQERKEI